MRDISTGALQDAINTLESEKQYLMQEVAKLREERLETIIRSTAEPGIVGLAKLLGFAIRRRLSGPRQPNKHFVDRWLEDWKSKLPLEATYRAWALGHEPRLLYQKALPDSGPSICFNVIIRSLQDWPRFKPLIESLCQMARAQDAIQVICCFPLKPPILETIPKALSFITSVPPNHIWDQIQQSNSQDYFTWLEIPGMVPAYALKILIPYMVNEQYDLIYCDDDTLVDGHRTNPHFKPEFSPVMLQSTNYLTGLTLYHRRIGFPFRDVTTGYHLALKYASASTSICRVPEVLFHADSQFDPDHNADFQALSRHVAHNEWVSAERTETPSIFRVRHILRDFPPTSIIIPTRDNVEYLSRCINSLRKTIYPNFRILIVDNGSQGVQTLNYLSSLSNKFQVMRDDSPFNFSRLMNRASQEIASDILVFLNDDTEVINEDWLDELVGQLWDETVGAVGALLLYPDERIQHAGAILGIRGLASHAFKFHPWKQPAYHRYPEIVREYSTVTGACMAVRKSTFESVGAFDEDFSTSFNDTDLCLRMREANFKILFTPHAKLYHHETASRPREIALKEVELFRERWQHALSRIDPFYSPNLSRLTETFEPDALSTDIPLYPS